MATDETDETPEGLKARIKTLAAARDSARAEAAELRGRITALEGEIAPLKAGATKFETERATWARERVFLEVGLSDPEAREIATMLHGRLPEEGRPDLGTWLKTAKGDPTKAPKALQPYLGGPPPAANPAPPAPGANPPPAGNPPPAPPRVETSPSAGNVVSADAIRAAAQQAARTGDWRTYEGLKAQVDAERTRR